MSTFDNKDGGAVLLAMVDTIQKNKAYLSDIDGLIGDGDHGVNMNKGFSLFEKNYCDKEFLFSEGLEYLGMTLMNDIGGSMGPIYGTIFTGMSEAGSNLQKISLTDFAAMLENGYKGLSEIIEAKVGDKTLVDTLIPAINSLRDSVARKEDFKRALLKMKTAAKAGSDSTKNFKAKYGRASRLGERSIGVLDTGSVSCYLLLSAMADSIITLL
ncbi:dihydroxyacetone kinase subunit DhaL [Pectinatus frisingensis]|uniref:dihydroxyacetone kinase subunit DhaL n=1 Tax=Pectinatus frisingensis TaxID=865 RepID=UPI0018C6865A|nr:dihydroxyacetone kinase subunit DhaL [Pectinatus frisingensis]